MKWTKWPTPFSFSVFVVWKKLAETGKEKGRVVVDIRTLNKVLERDFYPMPDQLDILNAIKRLAFISVINTAQFFYQFWIKEEHQYKLTMISYRGQKTFKVLIIKYKNTPAFVQRVINNLLKNLNCFYRVY